MDGWGPSPGHLQTSQGAQPKSLVKGHSKMLGFFSFNLWLLQALWLWVSHSTNLNLFPHCDKDLDSPSLTCQLVSVVKATTDPRADISVVLAVGCEKHDCSASYKMSSDVINIKRSKSVSLNQGSRMSMEVFRCSEDGEPLWNCELSWWRKLK